MKMSEVQFPAILPQSHWKRALKVAAGRVAEVFAPRRAKAVAEGRLPQQLGRLDRTLLATHVDRHLRAGTPEALAPLHAWLWSGSQAVKFHELAKARFDSWWLAHHSTILVPLAEVFDDAGLQLHTLCEIGCGSGLVIEDVARRLPAPKTLIGLDLSAEQTERNRQQNREPRIRFESGDASNWIPRQGLPGCCYFTNAGVLEYFPRQTLVDMFGWMGRSGAPCAIALIEPLAPDYDLINETASRIYNSENSLSHNYPKLLGEAGFVVRYQTEQRFDRFRWLLLVATADRGRS